MAITLLNLGANIDAYRPGIHRGTALHHATKRGLDKTVTLLLQRGANPMVINDAGLTPLQMARNRGHASVVRILEEHLCLFSGTLREISGLGFLGALAPSLVAKKIWAVVLPFELSTRRPPVYELALYQSEKVAQPRTTILLSKAEIEEPKFNSPDPVLCITDKTNKTKYKFLSECEGDKAQLDRLYKACKGVRETSTATSNSTSSNPLQNSPVGRPNGTATSLSSGSGASPNQAGVVQPDAFNGWGAQSEGYNGWVSAGKQSKETNSSGTGWEAGNPSYSGVSAGKQSKETNNSGTGWEAGNPSSSSGVSAGKQSKETNSSGTGWEGGHPSYSGVSTGKQSKETNSSGTGWEAGNLSSSSGVSAGKQSKETNSSGTGWKAGNPSYSGSASGDAGPSAIHSGNTNLSAAQASYLQPSAPPLPEDSIDLPFLSSSLSPGPGTGANLVNDEKAGGTCVICLDARAEAACVPCGHLAGCMECLSEVKAKDWGCPVCREQIQQIVKVYTV
ncbi:hypothetical protein KP509_35G024000 [Ceratopteris richardii]|nr:hypothetical protein KP509_35G024000 [Ceratopteris richardii]